MRNISTTENYRGEHEIKMKGGKEIMTDSAVQFNHQEGASATTMKPGKDDDSVISFESSAKDSAVSE